MTNGYYGWGNFDLTVNTSFTNNGFIYRAGTTQGDWNYTHHDQYYGIENLKAATVDDVKFANCEISDFNLLNDSPFKNAGTDGNDLGPDIAELAAATSGVVNP